MTQFVDTLMKGSVPEATPIYARAVELLDDLAKHGFSKKSEQADGSKLVQIPFNNDDRMAIALIETAADMTQDVNATYNPKTKQLELRFPSTFEAPPTYTMQSNLDKLKRYLFDECIFEEPGIDGYFVCDPKKLPIRPVPFVQNFIQNGEPMTKFYRLDRNTSIVAENGMRYSDQDLVSEDLFRRYLQQYAPDRLAKLDANEITPEEIAIAPKTFQRMIEQLELKPKGRAH